MMLRKLLVFVLLDLVLLLAGVWYYVMIFMTAPPNNFTPQQFMVEPGQSLRTIATNLEAQNIIRSAFSLSVLFYLREDSTQIKAGTYVFEQPHTAHEIADILVTGQFDNELLTLTLVEGARASAYGRTAAAVLDDFNLERWDELTAGAEGTLFPDTYRVPPDYSADELFTLLRDEHQTVLESLLSTETETQLSVDEAIILASILEREANTEASMRTVAGILLNRLNIGMPLQADATIEYVLETPLGELPPGQLAAELREIESPYNTYKNAGLPPTPIGNPGRQAIAAVLAPTQTDYLYYITGEDGEFYYAATYDQHLINIERHLK